MRKYALLVILMAFIVAFASGCDLVVKDAELDAQQVIIEVVGTSIAKAEVQQAIANVMDYQEYMYSYYGLSYDRTDPDSVASAQQTAIDSLIEEAVKKQKIQEYGLDQFTDEELATLTATADEMYTSYASSVETYYFPDTELTGDELDAAVEAKMLELGYGSKESMLEDEKLNESLTKLEAYVVKDVTVTDDEISSKYATGVSDAITDYGTTLTNYASDVSNGAIIYYTPSGYRNVKNLLIKISDEDASAIATLTSDLADAQASLDSTQTAIDGLTADAEAAPEDETADATEARQKSMDELTQQLDSLTAEVADLTAQLGETTETAYAAIQPVVDEVLAKLDEGEDFVTLMDEYGEDTGMQTEPTKSTGYLVCEGLTTYVDVFVENAMALQKVGDVSEPFRSDYGVHIVQYASEVEQRQAKLSEIRDQIEAELLQSKQTSLYDETVAQWVTDADAKVYTKRLDN